MEELLPAVKLDETLTNIMNEILGESTLNCETSNTSFDSSYSSEIENVQPSNFEIFYENPADINVPNSTLRLILRALSTEKTSVCVESSTKKRPRQPDMWQQNIRKKLRQSGKPYTDKHGIQRAGRKLGLPCAEGCFYQCNKKFNENARLKLHNNYWSLGDVEKKAYIFLSVQPSDVKRRRKSSTQRKTRSFQYYFETENASVQVCKKFFLSTIGISERKIYYLYNARNNEEGVGETKPKIRGRPRITHGKNSVQTICEKIQEIENQNSACNNITGVTNSELGAPCDETCLYQCTKRFNEQARAELHSKFADLTDTEKELYIFGSVKQSEEKCVGTFDYFIDTNIATFQVCEKFYLNTIGVSGSMIYHLLSASAYEEEILEPKSCGIPTTNIDKIQGITEHVLNFYAL